MTRSHTATWTWRFDRPPAEIWPLIADTVRFNEAAKLPKHRVEETPQADGSVLYRGHSRVAGIDLTWQEVPVTWVHERWFHHLRIFESGPLKQLCATFELAPGENGGSVGTYTLEVEPANLLGRLVILGGFLNNAGRTFAGLARDANAYAKGEAAWPFRHAPPALTKEQRARLDRLTAELARSEHAHGLADKLRTLIAEGMDADVTRIRPLALARRWDVPDRPAIELCLEAARTGLLEVRWDLLCPRCRIAKATTAGLDELPRGSHCDTCNIDYERDYANNIELCFQPNPAVRPVADGEYCLFGPMSTPHILAQVRVEPGERRDVAIDLPAGLYRLRTLEAGPETTLEWSGAGTLEVAYDGEAVTGAERRDGATPLALANASDRPRVMIVEDRGWARDALTADHATTVQAFRDLFGADVLRPGDEVAVRRIAFLFSDLRGSTDLYERLGEAAAYRLVREHFAYMTGHVRAHDGAVVKTIGDAVMASFARPRDALAAALAIQREIAGFNAGHGGESLTVKLGVHDGPCIVVTLNGRLDYFGSTVNMAARLQAESAGGDVVLSETSAGDPELAPLLDGLAVERRQASLKGFRDAVEYLRLRPAPARAAPAAE